MVKHKSGRGQVGEVTLAVAGDFGRDPRSLKESYVLGGPTALA